MKMSAPDCSLKNLTQNGFAIQENVIDQPTIDSLIDAIIHSSTHADTQEKSGATYAIRHLCRQIPRVQALSLSAPIKNLVEPLLGTQAKVVRSLLFDKNRQANWKVPWHQDLTIAVKEKHTVEGFGPWSIKAGIHHVMPPASVLAQMLTLRIHLDAATAENGPLKVIPGSHTQGFIDPASIPHARQQSPEFICTTKAGGAVLMRPLILHASSQATNPAHRRVIHLEFAANNLPAPLQWQD